ncbi:MULTISPECIES: hypothetical protein [unclassified Roseovarius]|uniref:hypothetical protein n=1 Tax=unclassified Roseovarius TaxID=2614913 RepID=UPI00273F10DC|nr:MULTISPECIES: hypothetical protein [unclassified Roseovarius]
MARYFDAQAALAEIKGSPIHPIHPIQEGDEARNRTNRVNRVPPDPEIFEERAAIIEFDAGLSRDRAEDMAAKAQGYGNVVEFRAAVQSMQEGSK